VVSSGLRAALDPLVVQSSALTRLIALGKANDPLDADEIRELYAALLPAFMPSPTRVAAERLRRSIIEESVFLDEATVFVPPPLDDDRPAPRTSVTWTWRFDDFGPAIDHVSSQYQRFADAAAHPVRVREDDGAEYIDVEARVLDAIPRLEGPNADAALMGRTTPGPDAE